MSVLPISGSDVPQKEDLGAVRSVVEAVAKGARTTQGIAEETGIRGRHVNYAVLAAKTLGWLEREGVMQVTSDGLALLGTTPGTAGERLQIRLALEQSRVLAELAPGLLGPSPPTRAAIVSRIQRKVPSLSPGVADRRAGTILSWLRQATDPQGELPFGQRPLLRTSEPRLPDAVVAALLRWNPWWEGRPGMHLPPHERDFVATIQARMERAKVVAVRGPRQVGKTTAQLQVLHRLLDRGVPPRYVLRIQFDELPSLSRLREPLLRIVEWYEAKVLGCSLNEAARAGIQPMLFLDEVQNLAGWAVQLKHLVDETMTRAVVTGSSALRIELGRDSLAGRLSTLEVGPLSLREIAMLRFAQGLETGLAGGNGFAQLGNMDFFRRLATLGRDQRELRDRAFAVFAARGGYPRAHVDDLPWPDLAEQLNEDVVRRVIQHDLRLGDRGRHRDAGLLEEVFRLACRYAGQAPRLERMSEELRVPLGANVGVERVRRYLDFLKLALLVRPIQALELRLKRSKAPAKLCIADHALRAAWLQEIIPLDPNALDAMPEAASLAGHIVESIVGNTLVQLPNLDVAHFPERPNEPEVDFVLTLGTQRIPVEVKYRNRLDGSSIRGLRSFIDRKVYNAPFGLLITKDDAPVADPDIVALPLASFLLLR